MMNDKKIIIGFVILTLLILGGGVYILSATTANTAQVNPVQNAKVEVDAKTYDWGNIPYSGPDATKTFIIKNTGTDALKLTNIKTSCACTSAQVTIDGVVSPSFGMHTTSSWVGEVAPGKEANLTVIFDQDFHGPTGVGPVERLVSMETNDINNPRLEFSLKGVVVK
jgi:archaellum component FlaG (FlaF/FlaG flagellin family)